MPVTCFQYKHELINSDLHGKTAVLAKYILTSVQSSQYLKLQCKESTNKSIMFVTQGYIDNYVCVCK